MKQQILRLDTVIDGKHVTNLVALEVGKTTVGQYSGIKREREELIGKAELEYRDLKCARIFDLFVAKAARRQGIAGELLARCCEIAKESGCKTIGMRLEKNNDDARDCYEKNGFQLVWEEEHDDGQRLMVKQLT